MIPKDLKNIFGLKDEKDVNMANNIWKMLDDMANQDPQQYSKFIQKNIKQGFDDVKQKKQEKEKPFKVKVKPGFCINMSANLNQKPLQSAINQKMLITKQPWSEVKKKFSNSIKIIFNIAQSDRIKPSKSKSSGKLIQKYSSKTLSDIQFFYYSLQGPVNDQQDTNKIYFCIILSTKFYEDMMNEPAGKKTLLGICLSYFQERLSLDKNPLLTLYNPQEHRRLAFYTFDKFTIEISDKSYLFAGKTQPQEFLLQKEVDIKRQGQLQKQKIEKKAKQQKQTKPKLNQIKFRQETQQQTPLPQLKISTQPPSQKKKVLIQVLKEQQNQQNSNQISYEMKETQNGYQFQFLLSGVGSIKEVDLQMKMDSVRLRVKDKKQLLINLKKPIKQEEIKAKFKKKLGILTVQVPFK